MFFRARRMVRRVSDSPQPNVSDLRFSRRFWGLAVLTGAGAGLTSGMLMKLLRLAQHLAFGYQSEPFLQGVEQATGNRRVIALVVAGVFGGVSLYLLRRFSSRQPRDLSETIWCNKGELPLLPTVLNALISICLVGMGAAVGRETALKQAGAVVAAGFSDGFRLDPAERRVLVACGIGAGMAAAYNVPFGGALFALEVLLGTLSVPLVLVALTTSFIAVCTSYLMLPDAPTYALSAVHSSAAQVIWAALAGCAAGLATVPYVWSIGWATTHKPKGWHLLLLPLAALSVLGFASLRFPELLGNGKNVVQMSLSQPFPITLLIILLFLRPLGTAICFRCGIPGGLFTPTMTFGALLGDALGRVWNYFRPGLQASTESIVISGAVLAAATQGPLSSVVFILELTRTIDGLLLPLLVATAIATLVSRQFEPNSIYSVKVKKRKESIAR